MAGGGVSGVVHLEREGFLFSAKHRIFWDKSGSPPSPPLPRTHQSNSPKHTGVSARMGSPLTASEEEVDPLSGSLSTAARHAVPFIRLDLHQQALGPPGRRRRVVPPPGGYMEASLQPSGIHPSQPAALVPGWSCMRRGGLRIRWMQK